MQGVIWLQSCHPLFKGCQTAVQITNLSSLLLQLGGMLLNGALLCTYLLMLLADDGLLTGNLLLLCGVLKLQAPNKLLLFPQLHAQVVYQCWVTLTYACTVFLQLQAYVCNSILPLAGIGRLPIHNLWGHAVAYTI